ncbi:hypothetical protein F8N00_15870 [Exiguobacterium sp. A1_3_1]|uniref:restriction endonuclease subunit S n=1 Tax=Exiguobacterium sp. A1_3_1 TaxID=2651871 RepID=UPI003B880748
MEYKLEDLIEIKHGYAFKSEDFSEEPTRNILLSPGNVSIGGGFNSRKKKYYREDIEVNRNYVFSNGDIFITMTDLSKEGDTLGYPAKIPENTNCNYLHNQRLGKVILKNEKLIDLDYLYYLLCTREYRGYILGTATGSTVKHTSPTKILDYKINLPELHVQKKVSSILSSLDKKILVNNKTIELLEQISQTIFKSWFIDFEFPNEEGKPYKSSGGAMVNSELGEIPSSFKTGNFKDILELKYGKSLTKKNRIPGEYPVYGSGGITGTHANYLITGPGLIIGRKGSIGTLYLEFNNFYPIDTVFYVESKTYEPTFLYLLFKQYDFTKSNNDSAVPGLNRDFVYNTKIIIPMDNIVREFQKIITPIYEQIENTLLETKNLQSLRDFLLPKLISGETKISKELEV